MTRAVLITGADGYLGARIAERYLRHTDAPLLLWVRAADAQELAAKRERLARRLTADERRVSVVGGDLRDADPFGGIDPAEVETILHAAAVTRFNVDEETARHVNTDGTAKLLRFVDRCPRLESVGVLSTVYASGLCPGPIPETAFDDAHGFANHYEGSKWAMERLLFEDDGRRPWRLIRVATVIADDDTGTVTQFNAFHNTLKLWFYGLLSLLPGDPAAPLYFVTGDWVADAVFGLMEGGEAHGVYHACHGVEEAVTIDELMDFTFRAFEEDDAFRARRILRPVRCDAESFELLAQGVETTMGGPVGQSVASIAPFARQLFVRKAFRNDNLRRDWAGYVSADVRALVARTCRLLVQTRWGREVANAAT